jgi:hypothetical protein
MTNTTLRSRKVISFHLSRYFLPCHALSVLGFLENSNNDRYGFVWNMHYILCMQTANKLGIQRSALRFSLNFFSRRIKTE